MDRLRRKRAILCSNALGFAVAERSNTPVTTATAKTAVVRIKATRRPAPIPRRRLTLSHLSLTSLRAFVPISVRSWIQYTPLPIVGDVPSEDSH